MTSLPSPSPTPSGITQIQLDSIEFYITALLVPESICLAIQSSVFGLVVGVGMSYYRHNRDGWKLRSFVTSQLALNITILAISWRQFIKNLENVVSETLGNVEAFFGLLRVAISLAGLNIMLSQYFLGYHVIRLNKKWPGMLCAAFIFIFSSVGFALSVWVVAGQNFLYGSNVVVFHLSQELFIVLADLIATIFFFRHYRKIRHGFVENQDARHLSRTSRLMKKIMIMVVNRGVLVTCAQFAFFGPSTLGFIPWIPLNASLANVYVLTTLMILNTRSSIRGSLKRSALDPAPTNLQSAAAIRPWNPASDEPFSVESTVQRDVEMEMESILREEEG